VAMKPKRPCRHPGCSVLVEDGYCEKHRPRRTRDRSAEAESWRWMYKTDEWIYELRPAQLLKEPFCRECAKRGYCTLTSGDVTDNSYVDNWICEGERDHQWFVREADYDGHNATDLAIRMCEERNSEDFCVEVAQTCAGQNLAVKTFRELLLRGKVIIEENPMVIWCFANAIEITNNYGDIKLSKKHKDDTERIDPVAAMMNALARVLVKRQAGSNINDHVLDEEWDI